MQPKTIGQLQRRIVIGAGFCIVAFALIGLRLVHVTVMSGPVTAGFSDHEEIARADLTDRNGELLARDLPVKDLYARPHVFWDKDQAAHAGHASAGWPDAASTNA